MGSTEKNSQAALPACHEGLRFLCESELRITPSDYRLPADYHSVRIAGLQITRRARPVWNSPGFEHDSKVKQMLGKDFDIVEEALQQKTLVGLRCS